MLASAILAMAAGGLLPGSRAHAADLPAPLAAYDFGSLPEAQFDKGAWSEAVAEDGVSCRKALAGKFAGARIKAWWKEGDLRPAEGERFVLEVKYKDVLAKPAPFHVFSGIGKNFGFWALGPFGGAHDDRWKTASIPVPWDMVARLVSAIDPARNAPEMTAVAIAAPADLPIACVSVRKAVAEDEVRYYAETRASIAAEQAELRSKVPAPGVKDPPAVQGPMAAFPWEPTCRLFQDAPVPAAEIGRPVRVRMCLDELEPGSFGVLAGGAALTGVDYEVTPLTDSAGRALQATIERRTAEYALLDGRWTPIRLWPAYAADVPAGHVQWFYFNIETRRGASVPGVYKGTIRIRAKEAAAELPLEVAVLPVDLLTMDEAGLTMFGCYDRLPPLHDVAFERRYNYGGALLWYAGFSIPVAMQDGKLVLDFTYPDDWMKGARQRGFTGAIWYLGGDSARMPGSLKVFAHLGTLDKTMSFDAWTKAQGGQDHVLPETRQRFVEWMREVNRHAVASGWPELFPTPHDEPQKWVTKGAWIKPFFKDACAAIREADPRIRVYGCIHHVKGWQGVPDLWKVFIDDIDVYNTNAVDEDPDIGNKVRAAGAAAAKAGGRDKLFWQYTGLGGGVPEYFRFRASGPQRVFALYRCHRLHGVGVQLERRLGPLRPQGRPRRDGLADAVPDDPVPVDGSPARGPRRSPDHRDLPEAVCEGPRGHEGPGERVQGGRRQPVQVGRGQQGGGLFRFGRRRGQAPHVAPNASGPPGGRRKMSAVPGRFSYPSRARKEAVPLLLFCRGFRAATGWSGAFAVRMPRNVTAPFGSDAKRRRRFLTGAARIPYNWRRRRGR